MHSVFLQFLEQVARSGGYEPAQTCTTFNLAKSPDAKGVLPGAVYGIVVALNDVEARILEAEARDKKSLKTPLSKIKKISLGQVDAIPIYWGKDAAVGFRLYRHILDKNPKTGCLGGRFYTSLATTDLLVASLPVNDFVAFEKYVADQYPPMLYNVKASNIGRFS
ncbi:hypothetical protein [Methylovulum miyakonense]|uniref:hypothetical protein n=1 Tax=Methylovulum miyakonense TaxID=645578 RepID=UPI00036D4658|nr:hypothetical protein [Methylovulum miyakonense]